MKFWYFFANYIEIDLFWVFSLCSAKSIFSIYIHTSESLRFERDDGKLIEFQQVISNETRWLVFASYLKLTLFHSIFGIWVVTKTDQSDNRMFMQYQVINYPRSVFWHLLTLNRFKFLSKYNHKIIPYNNTIRSKCFIYNKSILDIQSYKLTYSNNKH